MLIAYKHWDAKGRLFLTYPAANFYGYVEYSVYINYCLTIFKASNMVSSMCFFSLYNLKRRKTGKKSWLVVLTFLFSVRNRPMPPLANLYACTWFTCTILAVLRNGRYFWLDQKSIKLNSRSKCWIYLDWIIIW